MQKYPYWISKEKWIEDSRGHIWAEYKVEVDIFAFENISHNGPKCVKCRYVFCHHCNEDKVPDSCTGGE